MDKRPRGRLSRAFPAGMGKQRGSPGRCIPAGSGSCELRWAGRPALAADTSAGREGLEFGILFFWRGAVGAKSLIN